MKIRNINGTSQNVCKCGGWLQHWLNFSEQQLPMYCPAATCSNKPTVGAHVQKDSSNDKDWYIIPLCSACNAKQGQSLEVSSVVRLVPANVSKTCGQ